MKNCSYRFPTCDLVSKARLRKTQLCNYQSSVLPRTRLSSSLTHGHVFIGYASLGTIIFTNCLYILYFFICWNSRVSGCVTSSSSSFYSAGMHKEVRPDSADCGTAAPRRPSTQLLPHVPQASEDGVHSIDTFPTFQRKSSITT